MINILIMVVSCKKNRKLWDDILKRGIKNTVIVCGDDLNTDYYLDEKVLYVNCRDSYDGLPEKIVCALTAINTIKQYDNITHILKVDDHDTIFSKANLARLEKYGSTFLSSNSFICQHIYKRCAGSHHINKCPGSKWNKRLYEGEKCAYAAGGFSYILDRHAVQKIVAEFNVNTLEKIREMHIYEDLMISLILKKHDIYPVKRYYGIESTDPIYRNLIPMNIRQSFLNLPITII